MKHFTPAVANKKPKATLPVWSLAPVLLAAAIGYFSGFTGFFGALSWPNSFLFDIAVTLGREAEAKDAWPSTFTLLIDQATLDREPWSSSPRALYHPHLARLGREALDLGARKIGYDLVLALDPSRLKIEGADLRDYDKPMRDLLSDEGDKIVLGAYPGVQPDKAYSDIVGTGGVGVVDLQSEDDGIVRSVATRVRSRSGGTQASFAELVSMPTDGELTISERQRYLLFPRAPLRTAPLLPVAKFEDCLRTPEGKERLAAFMRGRNVLIGTGILGEDLRRGPDRFMSQAINTPPSEDPCAVRGLDVDFGDRNLVPGVLLQAAAVESAVSPETPRLVEAPGRAGLSAAMAGIATLLFQYVTKRLARMPASRPALLSTSVVAFCAVAGAIFGLFVLFAVVDLVAVRALHLWFPLGDTLWLVSGFGLLGVMTLAVRRDLALADLRIAFGRYLPTSIVTAALERRETTGGEERVISVLIADLRGFTPYCDARSHEPSAIMKALNQKFATAQDILDRYDACLDKFNGDAVIAFWNGFGDQPDHAARAIAAAIEIAQLDRAPDHDARDPLQFKVAVASGIAFVGSYGSKQKMNFSAIGEPMNLAARLEGMCNDFGVDFIAPEEMVALARKGVVQRPDIVKIFAENEFIPIGSATPEGISRLVRIVTVKRR